METMRLGLLAYRAGEKIEYQGVLAQVTNSEKANSLLNWRYRESWPLMG